MKKMVWIRCRTLVLLFTVLIFCTFFYGCSKAAYDTAPSEEDTNSFQSEEKITVGKIQCDVLAQELAVQDADIEDLKQILPQLPNLNKLILEGVLPDTKQLLSLKEMFPEVSLVFQISLGEKSLSTDTEILDLSNTVVDADTLSDYLPLFFKLKELDLTGTELTDEEKMALCDHLRGIAVRCELPLAGQRFCTDSTELDISGCPVTVEEVEKMLTYFPRVNKLDMSFCGLPDEEMDKLNQQYPDISIVWTVTIGEVKVRTDAVYFYPAESNYYPTNEQMKKLRYCTELVAIDIGHTRATDCEFLWYTPKVRYLILADTGVTDITPVGNLKELIYLELFNLRTKDYSPLLNCTKLQDLNIGTTHADPEPLSKMTWLHNLQWHRADQDPDTKDAVLKLPEQLPDTNVELYPKKKARNIGGGWRYIPNYYVFRDIIGAKYFNQDQIWDYWGDADGDRIMACEDGKAFSAYTLAQIVRERIDRGEPIVGLKNTDSQKAEILYETLMNAQSWIREDEKHE